MAEQFLIDQSGMSDELFLRFVRLIYEVAGIRLSDQKKTLVVTRFQKRIRELNLESYEDYYNLIHTSDDEFVLMLNSITTNTTKFFRENHHFEFLKNNLLQKLMQQKQKTREIRIWSAGCSTGEEPYTIAISLLEKLLTTSGAASLTDPCRGWDIKILATDISTKVLGTAQTGVYQAESLGEDLPEALRKRYFDRIPAPDGDKYTVKEFVKRMIRFRRLNFKEQTYPFRNSFDIIFCRNVMIYFDEEMKQHVLKRFHKHLAPDGHLFLGHSETMFGSKLFSPVHITVYRKQ
jgi:chemotaxis protein methyltransferase CheR